MFNFNPSPDLKSIQTYAAFHRPNLKVLVETFGFAEECTGCLILQCSSAGCKPKSEDMRAVAALVSVAQNLHLATAVARAT